jgi:thiosulfate/3-mercaptopyruvate sulfurtransferase
MKVGRVIHYSAIALILALGITWSLASAQDKPDRAGFPGSALLVDAAWLKDRLADQNLVVVDVRSDKDFDKRAVPGAVRMPWGEFRYNDPASNQGGLFVGLVEAQKILGRYGISRGDAVVLYDSVVQDGGATASYVFWVLEVLGHQKVMMLDRGIDAWAESGGEIASETRKPEPVLYQAPPAEVRLDRWATGGFIYSRLGDPYYQVLDVRSPDEYLGRAANPALDKEPLKLGHIPTSFNYNYSDNWIDKMSKALKTYPELLEMYRGLDPNKAVITYCHSARRGSYSYFIMRLMGFQDVRLYDASWFEWGSAKEFFPVELEPNKPAGTAPPLAKAGGTGPMPIPAATIGGSSGEDAGSGKTGYISCGG